MTAKFEGEEGRRRLIESLLEQKVVGGNPELAAKLAEVCTPMSLKTGDTLIEQGAEDDTLYLILSGAFDVRINNRPVARRFPGNTVGEMAAILPAQQRSATVIAAEPSWVAQVTEAKLTDLGKEYPFVWRCFARELAQRLYQRNALLMEPRQKIRVFIISSVEGLEVAREIENAFDHDPFEVIVWTHGVFRAAQYPIENLERELDQADFAVAVIQPEDLTTSREETMPSPRDNVVFELGFFMGRLSRQRTFLVEPRGKEIKLPTDLIGIEAISYQYAHGGNLTSAMGPACNRLRTLINELGPIT